MTKDELVAALEEVHGRAEICIQILEHELAPITKVKIESNRLVVLTAPCLLDIAEAAAVSFNDQI
jgi:hypothetical protein